MLKLVDVKKDYLIKDQESVHALRGITLNFRKNEFVAILGHSGCGKTTLLNIIGGLDKYSSGDLIIEGRSTKEFSDRDWDTYRNHSIGFVFQSYNLIPHQNLLQNVELALTIGGISKKERKERASKALARVGLGGLDYKKPNQLSGGQMQRVAIARALVNNPEILLADEPTGALDSETSVQIMDLLKEVAKDRLVIMVTHNPDLAHDYASRIVRMSDGHIIDDSNPFEGIKHKDKSDKEIDNKSKKKSSMSFFTATALSFSNLMNKLRRTILVMVAGSIGIIGVATVLAVSTGVNNYIDKMQNDMLSSYPIGIAEETVDYTSLITGLDSYDAKEILKFDPTTEVGMDSMINYLMSAYTGMTKTKTNDINNEFVEYINNISDEDAAFISYDYGIDVTNNIFTTWNYDDNSVKYISLNGLTQSYIAELKTVEGFSSYASYVDLFTDFMKELPTNTDYILSQYDLIAGSKVATGENEIMLVVGDDTTLTDLNLAQMGFYAHEPFINIAISAIEKNDYIKANPNASQEEKNTAIDAIMESHPYNSTFTFDDILDKEFYYLPNNTIYEYGNVSNKTYTKYTLMLTSGFTKIVSLTYDEETDSFTGYAIENMNISSAKVIYLQREGSKDSTLTDNTKLLGTWKGMYGSDNYMVLDLNTLTKDSNNNVYITSDLDTFDRNTSTPSQYKTSLTEQEINENIESYKYSAEQTTSTINNLDSNGGMKLKVVGILRQKQGTSFGCLSRGVYYTNGFAKKYMQDTQSSNLINDSTNGFKKYFTSDLVNSKNFQVYVTYDFINHQNNNEETYGYASALNGDLTSSFTGLFASLTGVNYSEQNSTYLRSLCGLKAIKENDEYVFKQLPASIKIYPFDFECKNNITSYLDAWNQDKNHSEITYSDTISIIVAVIDTLIESITIALIVFTSLSLVVSCFMIAVITYISVMERVKEIGVIRSLGGRKKDVSRLFISENLITGLSSGIFGVLITYGLCLILNTIVSKFGVNNIGDLTPLTALIMISLSVFLSVFSGLIPSMKASNEDPVAALRSE